MATTDVDAIIQRVYTEEYAFLYFTDNRPVSQRVVDAKHRTAERLSIPTTRVQRGVADWTPRPPGGLESYESRNNAT